MNSVRIIAGQWRRRVLRFPDSEGLRPTPDRVRETVFNWLGQELDGLDCLDLFAGSGALGFEAASRGAASVVMLEQAPRVHAALSDNARLLDAGGVLEIRRGDALQYLASAPRRFDVVFLDPPYRKGWLERLAPHLPSVLKEDGLIYAEAEHEVAALGDWRSIRHGKAGEVHYQLLARPSA